MHLFVYLFIFEGTWKMLTSQFNISSAPLRGFHRCALNFFPDVSFQSSLFIISGRRNRKFVAITH